MKKYSIERRVYESEDDKNLSLAIFQNLTETWSLGVMGLNELV